MSSRTFPLIGGRRMRLTRLDACGVPAWGNATMAVSKGFVSVAVTANYDDGTEVVVRNASDERCVQRDAEAELINLGLAVTFCAVDPALYSAFTGFPEVLDPATGDVIGFITDRAIKPSMVKNALEVWSDAMGNAGCEEGEEVPYGYLLWPFLQGARVGDYTIENGAVTFSVTGILTKDGTQWGVGPYDVILDENGDPGPLTDPLTSTQHQYTVRTLVAPPDVTDGLVPLDDPDEAAATTATAGTPGTFNGVRPADFAALEASSITASPATAWTAGQRVVLGDGSEAHWDATDWVAGRA